MSGAPAGLERPGRPSLLITGATGFIGGRLAERLVADGHSVRCLVRAGSDTSRLTELGVELVVGDLSDASSLAGAAEGVDAVFHCAALVSDWATVEEISSVNVAGTRNLLNACARASVRRFIHLSTTDVYGHPGGREIDESHTPARFSNWYAQTKLEAEAEVRHEARAGSLEAVILRPATVYGPGSADVVGEIARAIEAGHMLLIDGGQAIAGLCYVENVIDAALLALEHEAAPGNAFNVSDGLPITWRMFTDDLAAGLGHEQVRLSLPLAPASAIAFLLEHGYRLLRRASGLETAPLLSRQAVQVLGHDQDFSTQRIREMLGWQPRVDYPAGLQATLVWLKDEYLPKS